MRTIARGYKGLTVLLNLNWDRIIYTGTLIVALYAGAYVGLM
jgi:hypothetical protein